ncbi:MULTISPECIES: hypothetical protein [Klebsiella]|uniref:hypothetical protein n=1 Tax=Klebsiella TaxID=570 RepID=UPI0012B752CF|nr:MULTISPECIES: hypothetical protein [Klebsiella]HEC2037728.1 hypothetical protein [Klebsiella oxytoca]MCM6077360.1 hypothetical protein [Klebsiella pneumoniae]MDV0977909.1 hypothetical protein [Klebsiella pneumoniae]MDV1909069.1 hypothetical protein [Klebsiella pasteurii]MDV1914848.1 hypothetical protein [Klebsiella pasteurii]
MDTDRIQFKIETLIPVLKSLGHSRLWYRAISYGSRYEELEFIVNQENERLAQWSPKRQGWIVTDKILCVTLGASQSVPDGELIDEIWELGRTVQEPLSLDSI